MLGLKGCSGDILSPAREGGTITQWDNPHITMKIKSLLSTIAVLVCAATASAQSDPSVGGSFGNSFGGNRTAGKVTFDNSLPDAVMSDGTTVPSRPSFWSRMTGRNRNITPPSASTPNRSWFSSHRPANTNQPAQSHGWFSSHRPATVHNGTHHTSWFHRSAAAPNKNTHNRWHLPFMNRN